MKIIAFCRKNGLVMQNQGLGIHSDKIWADSSTKNTLKYRIPKILYNLLGQSAQLAKIYWIFEKKLSLGLRYPCPVTNFNEITIPISKSILGKVNEAYDRIQDILINEVRDTDFKISQDRVNSQLSISQSVIVKVAQNEEEDSVKEIIVSWANQDEHLGSHLLSVLQNMGK